MPVELPVIKYFDHPACQGVSHRAGACGACCMNMELPPFQVDDDRNELQERFAVSNPAFMQRMDALGEYNRAFDLNHPDPCPMLDNNPASPDYRTCTIYDQRPDVCRNFTVGWDHCTNQRRKHGIRPAFIGDL